MYAVATSLFCSGVQSRPFCRPRAFGYPSGEVDRVSGQLRIIQRTNQITIRAHVDDNLNVVRFLSEDLFADLEGFDIILLL